MGHSSLFGVDFKTDEENKRRGKRKKRNDAASVGYTAMDLSTEKLTMSRPMTLSSTMRLVVWRQAGRISSDPSFGGFFDDFPL